MQKCHQRTTTTGQTQAQKTRRQKRRGHSNSDNSQNTRRRKYRRRKEKKITAEEDLRAASTARRSLYKYFSGLTSVSVIALRVLLFWKTTAGSVPSDFHMKLESNWESLWSSCCLEDDQSLSPCKLCSALCWEVKLHLNLNSNTDYVRELKMSK